MVPTKSLLFTTILSTALALPTPSPQQQESTDYTITPNQIIRIAPTTVACPRDLPYLSECADAKTAAPALTAAFEKYNITSPNTRAALIATMIYESGSFRYNHNHFPAPGRPGQGTRNMQMATYNEKYATDLFGAAAVAKAKEVGTQEAVEDRVLALVQGDEESFGSAAWLLKGCDASIEEGLATGEMSGWDAYLTECIGTEHGEDRDVAWEKAKEVLA
ncbi:hypothetical protein GRF29_77g152069 [Pseudopithomyces chartarum]|uniref:Uncharacterized protein n=1 Tax=Pseudopithomyces chartarum TaxID=1892770 RepID=A0AAN6LZM2_9PLEO|nr:hypothetical protein GRF29_77g152069 [Pseudopithomyces chartarum]